MGKLKEAAMAVQESSEDEISFRAAGAIALKIVKQTPVTWCQCGKVEGDNPSCTIHPKKS